MSNWLKAYTFSNIHISISAFCYALSTALIVGEYVPFSFLIIVFSGTLVAYLFHRMYPIWANHTIAKGNIVLNWTKKNKSPLNVLFVSAAIISLLSFIQLSFTIKLLLIALALVNIAYSIPFVINNGEKKAMRDWPFTKIILIAFTWAIVCAVLPIIAIGNFDCLTILGLSLEKFSFIVAITIPFDVKDIVVDKSEKIKTIPIKFGIDSAIVIAWLLLFLSLFFFFSFVESSLSVKLIYVLFYVFSGYLIFKSRKIQNEQFYLFGLDGLMILLFIGLSLFA